MAFFLVMWLITMVSPEKRARLATYFKHFSLFTESGTSFMKQSSEMFNERGESAQKIPNELTGDYNAMLKSIKETLIYLLCRVMQAFKVHLAGRGNLDR